MARHFAIRKAAIGLGVNGEINAVWVSEDGDLRLSIGYYANGEINYAWFSEDESIEIKRVKPVEFWSKFQDTLLDFLA